MRSFCVPNLPGKLTNLNKLNVHYYSKLLRCGKIDQLLLIPESYGLEINNGELFMESFIIPLIWSFPILAAIINFLVFSMGSH